MSEDKRSIETILEMEGIMAKGYGCVAKFAMLDTALKMTDKGLYAYLCSLSGGGTVVWPKRETILHHLQICKEGYHKSQKRLIEEGYLKISHRRAHGEHGWFQRTVYTIVLNPKRFQEQTQEPSGDSPMLAFQGMLSRGYGLVPRLVMQDTRISVKAKAVYAYLLTFACAGTTAFPSVTQMGYHLGMSGEVYRKYMGELESCGYVIRKRRRLKTGKLSVYDYLICANPEPLSGKEPPTEKQDTVENPSAPSPEKQDTVGDAPTPSTVTPDMVDVSAPPTEKPDTEKQDTVNAPVPPTEKPDTEKQDTVNVTAPPTEKPDTVKPDTVKPPTDKPPTEKHDHLTITSSTITNFKNTNSDHYHSVDEEEGAAAHKPAELMPILVSAGGIPTDYLSSESRTTQALYALCEIETPKTVHYFDPQMQSAWETVLEALRQLCTRPHSRVKDRRVTRQEIVAKLNNSCMERFPDTLTLTDFVEAATCNYHHAIEDKSYDGDDPLKKPINYARYIIWTTMQTYRLPET